MYTTLRRLLHVVTIPQLIDLQLFKNSFMPVNGSTLRSTKNITPNMNRETKS